MPTRRALVWFAVIGLVASAGILAARHASRTLPPRLASPPAAVRSDAASALRNLPLTFERNDGQFAPHVRFAGVQSNGSIAIHDDGFAIADGHGGMAPVAFTFVNVSRGRATGTDQPRARSHYFAGRDRRQWHTGAGRYTGFVTRFNAAHTGYEYSTYIGGSDGVSDVTAVAVDDQGSAYVTGKSDASDFPSTVAPIGACPPGLCSYFFVMKIQRTGTLQYSRKVRSSAYWTAIALATNRLSHSEPAKRRCHSYRACSPTSQTQRPGATETLP